MIKTKSKKDMVVIKTKTKKDMVVIKTKTKEGPIIESVGDTLKKYSSRCHHFARTLAAARGASEGEIQASGKQARDQAKIDWESSH